MKFLETRLPGAFVLELEMHGDSRGFFARTFSAEEFAAHGLESNFVQCNLSLSRQKGTLRGLHFQWAPHAEVKLVRCVRGAIRDVIMDLRPGSPTFGQHEAVELSAENRRAFYAPKGFAHGFQSLTDDAEVYYHMGHVYVPAASAGIQALDPTLGITWPLAVTEMSDKDRDLPTLAQIKDRLMRQETPGNL
jgi:dTDP-4-dehydrorhamnose 3,5-epimerase